MKKKFTILGLSLLLIVCISSNAFAGVTNKYYDSYGQLYMIDVTEAYNVSIPNLPESERLASYTIGGWTYQGTLHNTSYSLTKVGSGPYYGWYIGTVCYSGQLRLRY